MHPNSIYVLNIENFMGFLKVKEDSSFIQFGKYSKKAGTLSIDFSLNNFSLDRGIIGCASNVAYQIASIFSINGLYIETFQPLVISRKIAVIANRPGKRAPAGLDPYPKTQSKTSALFGGRGYA